MNKHLNLILCASLLLAVGCGGGDKPAAESKPATKAPEATAPAVQATPANLDNGKAIYDKYCFACHMTGVAGAAALTDKARWEANATKKMDLLVTHAWDGYTGNYGVLPAKGTCMDCEKSDLYDAIHYMMSQAGVKPTY